MPIKEININNTSYQVGCKEGQENHLNALAHKLNARVAELKNLFKGKCPDNTLIVLVALELEDKLSEKQAELDKLLDHVENRINKINMMLE